MFKPLVVCDTFEPISNPFCLFFINLLIKYDLPVRYMPVMVTMAIGLRTEMRKFLASLVRQNSKYRKRYDDVSYRR